MWFFLAVVLWGVFFALSMRDFVFVFLDIPTLVILMPAWLLAWAATSGKAFRQGVLLPFTSGENTTQEEARDACRFLRLLGNLSLLMGFSGVLIGGVIMLQNLSDPKKIGPALSIIILCLFYGVILKSAAIAAEGRISFRYNLPF